MKDRRTQFECQRVRLLDDGLQQIAQFFDLALVGLRFRIAGETAELQLDQRKRLADLVVKE